MTVFTFSTLAEAARRLNHALPLAPGKRRLPALIFMTDHNRAPDPFKALQRLEVDGAVIFRDYKLANRLQLATGLLRAAQAQAIPFLVGGDGALAETIGANGLHLPEHQVGEILHWRQKHPEWLITAAAHSAEALIAAHGAGADAALLSPVFATASHPETKSGQKPVLGAKAFCDAANASPLPVYALGGITPENAGSLHGLQAAGIAAIGAFCPDPASEA